MTLAAGIVALFEAFSVGIVANYLGTDVLIAYVVTELLIGLTDTFLAGPSDALHTVCAHAIGGENYTLAGQYVQIAAALYLLLGIPTLGVWYFWIGDIVRLMDLERVADMVSIYTKVVVWHYVLSGLFDGYNALLDITGHVTVVAVFDIIYGLTNVVILWLMCAYYEGFNLYLLGVTQLIVSVAFFIMFTFLVVYKGWLSSFAHGMLRTFALSVSLRRT
jgi:Na+-driven multidrug efflux pump